MAVSRTDDLANGESLARELQPWPERLVRALARQLRARLPHECGLEMADLIQAGNVGLLQAARTYDATRGAPFAGYARFRIRGEMMELIRRNAGHARHVISAGADDSGEWEARLPASPESSTQAGAFREQRRAIILEELGQLSLKDRHVVRLRYSDEMTPAQIGQALSVNESRTCQIHQRALGQLRRALWKKGVRRLSHL